LNILLITADQWRGDSLSSLGHPHARTPTLDRLAAEGVLFLRHHGQATPCGPARASLHTGLYACNHRSVTNGTPLDARHKTLARLLDRRGWDPVLFGYTDTSLDPRTLPEGDPALRTYEGVAPGFRAELLLPEHMGPWQEHLASRGYGRRDQVWDWYRGPLGAAAPWRDEDSETAFLTDRFLAWHAAQSGPWLAHLSFIKPHPPLVAAAPWHALVDPADVTSPSRGEAEAEVHPWLAVARSQPLGVAWGDLAGQRPCDLDDRTLRQLRASYFGLIAEVDHHLGRILDEVGADTLVIFTADHGEMLGDHGLLGKSGFYPEAFHVPLIIRMPGGVQGIRAGQFTEHVDLMPTILELLGIQIPLQCDGRSLVPFLRGEPPADWRKATHWEHDFRDVETRLFEQALGLPSDHCSILVHVEERQAYVHFTALPPLCFELEDDPGWTRNVALLPGKAGRVRDLAQATLSWRMGVAERRLTGAKLTPAGVLGQFDPL
jgi:arylsulfatase A-like enzyme